jgi:hypothetical protein
MPRPTRDAIQSHFLTFQNGDELCEDAPESGSTMKRSLVVVFALATLAGCSASHQGYLVKTETGQRNTVVFRDNPSGNRGSVEAVLGNGEQCHGQFNTVADQVTRNWEDPQDITSEDSQVGMAVLQCADSHVVKCDFARASEGKGSGQCLDNLGQKYSLNF